MLSVFILLVLKFPNKKIKKEEEEQEEEMINTVRVSSLTDPSFENDMWH